MEKKPKKQPMKKIQLNFDFSDDSGDEFCTPQVLKNILIKKRNDAKLQCDEQNNSTIISSEYLCRQTQLPSFIEDIGSPMMDSTHLVAESKGLHNSVCSDITKHATEKFKMIEASNSKAICAKDKRLLKMHIEHDHGGVDKGKENILPSVGKSIFTGYLQNLPFNKVISSSTAGKKLEPESNTKASSSSNISHKHNEEYSSLQSSSPSCSPTSTDAFTTASENSMNSSAELKSSVRDQQSTSSLKSQSSSDRKDESDSTNSSCSAPLSQEPSSYDVQDVSLQTSLPCSELSVTDQQSVSTIKSSSGMIGKYEQEEECKFTKGSVDKDVHTGSDRALSSHETSSYYYVQDMSLQTSLPHSEMSVLSSSSSPHPVLEARRPNNSPIKSQTFPISSLLSGPKGPQASFESNKDLQPLPYIITPTHDRTNSFHDLSENTSCPAKVSPVQVLAADSDSDLFSEGEEHNAKPTSVVVADSEEDETPSQLIDESGSETNKVSSENDISNDQETDDKIFGVCDNAQKNSLSADIESSLEVDKHQISSESSLRNKSASADHVNEGNNLDESSEVDKVTSSLNALSFHQGSVSHRRKMSSSSSEDDNFEDFLSKLKGNQESKKAAQKDGTPSTSMEMEDFICDDSLTSESDSCGDDSQEEESDDDILSHIKTTNLLDRTERSQRRPNQKTNTNHTSSSSESEQGSVSDQSDSSGDDDSFQGKTDKVDRGTEKLTPVTPAAGARQKSNVRRTNKTPLRAKSWQSCISPGAGWGSDSDDDFDLSFTVRREDTTASKVSLPGPFKTPKPRNKTASIFHTPVNKKVPQAHPWTAPRPIQSSRPSLEDDDSFFIKSLSTDYPVFKRHPEAVRYVKSFKSLRADLTTKLFDIFNKTVFDSKIPSTIGLEWNARYTKTAGTFSYKRSNPNMAKITLSNKVCDRPERVRDTLVHELCHAAVKLISGVNENHGPMWRSWARKVNKAFPFMPMVARCHDYVIHNKYTYQCVNCKYRIGRHSKSLDTERKVCGHCKGEFQVFLTSDLNSSDSSTAATPRTPRTPNRFALFVKDCYSEVKKRNTDWKHGDIMKELSKDFAEKNKI